jgi:hypothetical protein
MNLNDMKDTGRQGHSLFWRIHKALRACLCDTLMMVGSIDADDQGAVIKTLAQVRTMLLFCGGHMMQEERYIHPAMEERNPGSTRLSASEHLQQERAFAHITVLVADVESSSRGQRAEALSVLYQYLGRFVGESLVHMSAEESHDHGVLSAAYRDDELVAIEARIIAGMTPQQRAISLHWMLPAFTPVERAELLAA